MNLMHMFGDQISTAFKKYVFDMIGSEKYVKHEKILDIFSANVKSQKDFQACLQFFLEIYECGYVKSCEDHKRELAKINVHLDVVRNDLNATKKPIFKS